GKSLDPEINALEIAKPWATDLIRRQLDPIEVARRAVAGGRGYLQHHGHLPTKIHRSLTRLSRGELKGRCLHEGLDRTVQRLERTSNRVAMAIVLAALIIGSGIVLQAQGPIWWGVPAVGVIGFVLAAFIGLGLVIGILRSGRF